jgi:predicted nucleic acid-binding protein
MMNKVLDSFALLAFLQDEPGAQMIEDFILQAKDGKVELVMCVVNLGEVWYSISRTKSAEIAERVVQQVQGMPIEIVDADWTLTRQAAIYKSKGNISYADCYVAALAKLRKAEVVTGDTEFEILKDDVKIVWIK